MAQLPRMAWVVRYITLAGVGTLYDPDPTSTQPGELALDGAGQPIETHTIKSGTVWGDVLVVNDDGIPQPAGQETFDLAFVKRTSSGFQSLAGEQTTSRPAWNKGSVSPAQFPGIEQAQAQMESPASVALLVLAGANAPASGRLAVRMWEEA